MANATVGAWAIFGALIANLPCAPIAIVPATGVKGSAVDCAMRCRPVRNVTKQYVRHARRISNFVNRVTKSIANPANRLKRARSAETWRARHA